MAISESTQNANIAALQSAVGNLTTRVSTLETAVKSANVSLGNLTTRVGTLETSLASATTAIGTLTARMDKAESVAANLTARVATQETALSDVVLRLKAVETTLATLVPPLLPPPPPVTITDVAGVTVDTGGAVTITRNGTALMTAQAMWGTTTGTDSWHGDALKQTAVDPANKTVTFTGAGCTMVVRHSVDPNHPNRVVLDATFTNNSGAATPGFSLMHNLMYFPEVATNTALRSANGLSGVGYAEYLWSSGSAAIVNENQAQPITFSMGSWSNSGDLLRAIGWGLSYQLPVAPGQSVSARASLRFGESSSTGAYAEALAAYVSTHPYAVKWPDRRPIVPSFERWNGDLAVAAYPPLPDINNLVNQCKAMNAQGFILWDLLGNIAGDYGGDLRWLPQTNPTAAANVDAWMTQARAAGITPGLALRWGIPQMHVDAQGRFDPWYSDTTTGSTFAECAAFLIGQATYARDRWGCKIFYVDCADPSNADIWRQIQAAVPDCLFLPENVSIGVYGATAPYRESRQASGNNFENFSVELPAARAIWPQAFGVLKVDDETPERLTQFRPQIVAMVKSGVVLLGRDATWIGSVYVDAAK